MEEWGVEGSVVDAPFKRVCGFHEETHTQVGCEVVLCDVENWSGGWVQSEGRGEGNEEQGNWKRDEQDHPFADKCKQSGGGGGGGGSSCGEVRRGGIVERVV